MTTGMEPRTLQYIARACAGEHLTGAPGTLVQRVCTDSRAVRPGDLFVALAGDKFDGHDFLKEALGKDAAAVVVNRQRLPTPSGMAAVIAVGDTRQALSRLAAEYRADFKLPTIAIGGSNGKTTTKELVASVLRQKLSTLWSEASFNNDIGVPLTLLRIEPHHEAAVLEVGTNHPGELPPLVAMIRPRFGIITSIGREHLEFFGDIAGVAEEEGWLAELLPVDGKLFINADTPCAGDIARRTKAAVVRAGFSTGCDWRIAAVQCDERGVTFALAAPRAEFSGEYRVSLLGRHQALNAALAVAIGAELGLSADEIRHGLVSCAPAKMRLQVTEKNGVRILNDAYNANADSMLAALQTLQEFPCAGRRIAVLGDMAELGEHSAEAHAEIGRKSAELGVSRLVAVGSMAAVTAQAAREAGLQDVTECADVGTAVARVRDMVREGDVVLLKASRVTGLERVSEGLG
jgi:UDP-N-acetylmuramoyl-tripeptide--D-alanyl-D-alanine ligase